MRAAALIALATTVLTTPARGQCVLQGVSGAAFGSYDVMSPSPLDTTASVTYRCLVSLSITIDLSAGSSGSYATRTLTRAGGGTLTYNLYMDAARQIVWGNGANGTSHYTAASSLLSDVTVTVYGRIATHQDADVGVYSDTVVVTLNY